jgi:hypothetical protein
MAKKLTGWRRIGVVGVDSGQLLIADPCYIGSQWKDDGKNGTLDLGDTFVQLSDGKKFGCAMHCAPREAITMFGTYDEPLPSGKTPNQHIADGDWERVKNTEIDRSFSYRGCCSVTLSDSRDGQLNFAKGHAGAGVVASTAYGDGTYPVYGYFASSKDTTPSAMMVVTDDEIEQQLIGK